MTCTDAKVGGGRALTLAWHRDDAASSVRYDPIEPGLGAVMTKVYGIAYPADVSLGT